MTRPARILLAMTALLTGLASGSAGAAEAHVGQSLRQLLEELSAAGLPLLYSSSLVGEDLRVLDEPSSSDPVELLAEVLAPHALAVEEWDGVYLIVRAELKAPERARLSISVVADTGLDAAATATVRVTGAEAPMAIVLGETGQPVDLPAGRHLITVEAAGYLRQRRVVTLEAGERRNVLVKLEPEKRRLDEVVVAASRYEVRNTQPSSTYLTGDELTSLADLGDDPVRATQRLPGMTSNGFSAKSHVRGGQVDETAIILNGQELVEPFHGRAYESLFSTIDQRIISGIQVYSGGFPAAFGDSLSSVMLIEPQAPEASLHHEIGVSALNTSPRCA